MAELNRAKTCEEVVVNELYELREEVAKLKTKCEDKDETIKWLSSKYEDIQDSVDADKLIDLKLYNAFLKLCAEKIFVKEKGGIAVNEEYFAEFDEEFNIINDILKFVDKNVD